MDELDKKQAKNARANSRSRSRSERPTTPPRSPKREGAEAPPRAAGVRSSAIRLVPKVKKEPAREGEDRTKATPGTSSEAARSQSPQEARGRVKLKEPAWRRKMNAYYGGNRLKNKKAKGKGGKGQGKGKDKGKDKGKKKN